MNVERLTRLAEILEAGSLPKDYYFNMSVGSITLGHPDDFEGVYINGSLVDESNKPPECGTVCCIAGLTQAIWPEEFKDKYLFIRAAEVLGISDEKFYGRSTLDDDENSLFYPRKVDNWDKITPAQAAKVIRNLIATGEVDWSII